MWVYSIFEVMKLDYIDYEISSIDHLKDVPVVRSADFKTDIFFKVSH